LITLPVLCVLLAAVFVVALRYESRASTPLGVLSRQAYEAILSGETQIERSASAGVLYNGGVAAAYAGGSYLLSVPADAESALLSTGFSGKHYTAAFAPDDAFSDFAQAVSDGHVFSLVVSDGKRYFVDSVVFTTLPVVRISAAGASNLENWSKITIVSPDDSTVGAYCSYHKRGSVSLNFEKSSWHVTFYTTASNRTGVSLLGMRQSEEWNLVSLYTDPTRLRNKVTIDIWNEIAATNLENDDYGAHMEFCELVMDGDYCGLYGLMDPVDETLLGIDSSSNTYLFKVFRRITDDLLESYREDGDFISLFMELTYPSDDTAAAGEAWEIADDYMDAVYGGTMTLDAYDRLFNLSNAVDCALFFNCCDLSDNICKNYFLLWQTEPDGASRFSKIPWDLDYGFGNYFSRDVTTHTVFHPELYSAAVVPLDIAALLEGEPSAVAPLLAARWLELRADVLSEESIVGAFTSCRDALLSSGAYRRELERWPESPASDDLSELVAFIHARLICLDDDYDTLAEGFE